MKKLLSVAAVLMWILLAGTSGAWAGQHGQRNNSQAACPRNMNTGAAGSQGIVCTRTGQGTMSGRSTCPGNASFCAGVNRTTNSGAANNSKASGVNQ